MVKRLTPGAARKRSSGDIYHMRRNSPFVSQRRAATIAEAARGTPGLVFVASDIVFAVDYAKPFTPTSDVSCVGSTVRKPACLRMIVPSPTCGEIDLKPNRAAETLFCDRLNSQHREPFRLHLPALTLAPQTKLSIAAAGLIDCAASDPARRAARHRTD
jgi:hypothetical protein